MAQSAHTHQLLWEELKSSRSGGGTLSPGWALHRTKVPGGWLVLVINNPTGLTFYPDPDHKWDGGSIG
jgi:hypothetical protein